MNRAWEQLTGYAAERVVGLTCQDHAPTRAGDPADLAASFHPPPESLAGQPAGTPTLIFHAGGERLWRRLEFWPFRDEHQTLIGLLGQVRPVDCRRASPILECNPLHVELLEIRRRLQNQYGLDSLIGFGPSHRRLLDQVRLAAASKTPVLIVGEPGTGKRQVARTIHQQGPGRQRPLVAVRLRGPAGGDPRARAVRRRTSTTDATEAGVTSSTRGRPSLACRWATARPC